MKNTFLTRLFRSLSQLSYDAPGLDREAKRGLNLVILTGAMGSFFGNITTGSVWNGFLKALGTDDFVYSLLVAIPIIGGLFQIIAAYILEYTRKRKFLLLVGGITSRVSWITIGLLPLFVPMEQNTVRLVLLVFLLLFQSLSGTFLNAGFNSLLADLVPLRIRGHYLGTRSRISSIATILACLISALTLHAVTGMVGYAIIIAIAGLIGTLDIVCFIFVRFPQMEEPVARLESLPKLIKGVLKDNTFMKMVLFYTLWSFSVNVSAPFFTPYMTGFLGMSISQIIILSQVLSALFTMFFVARWGRMMDKFGDRPVTHLCMIIACILPFFWLFTGPGNYWMVPVVQIFSGATWCAVDLGAQNFLLRTSPNKNRTIFIAVHAITTQLFGAALGTVAGGKVSVLIQPVIENLNLSFFGFQIEHYSVLFILSAILRMITVFGFFRLMPNHGGESMSAVIAFIGSSFVALVKRIAAIAKRLPYEIRWRMRNLRYIRSHPINPPDQEGSSNIDDKS